MDKTSLLSIPTALLVACASPQTVPPTPVDGAAQEWQSPNLGSPGEIDSRWWEDFGDPELTRVVDAVLADNFDLASAATRVHAMAAQAEAETGRRFPQLNAGLDLSRSRSNMIGLPLPGMPEVLGITTDRHSLGLNLSWEIDLWGRVAAMAEAAEAELQVEEAAFAGLRLSLAGQAAKAYLMAKEADLQVQLVDQKLDWMRKLEEHLKRAYAQGAALAPLLQVQAQCAALEEAQLQRLEGAAQMRRALATLQGRYPQAAKPASSLSLPDLPAPVPAGLPADLIARRPDLIAAEARLRAAMSRSHAADASLYPALSLTSQGGTNSNDLKDLLDGDFKVWSLGANLTAPLFHGGALKAQAESTATMAQAAELHFAQSALVAFLEVEDGLSSEQRILQRMAQLKEEARLRQQELKSAETRYEAGVGDLASYLQAQVQALDSTSRLSSTHLLLLSNRIDLYLALGGGTHNLK